MRNDFLALLAMLCFCPVALTQTQGTATTTTTSMAAAQALIAQSVTAMGGSAPADSTASGIVQITAGSTSEPATFQVKTRGLLETRETIQAANGTQDRVYCSGQGSTVASSTTTAVALEQASSFQSGLFPLPMFQSALNNPDTIFEFVGGETLSGTSVQHVRFWNSYASQKPLQTLAPFSVKDAWLDAVTSLPRRISFDSRASDGRSATVHVDFDFSAFQSFNGILYPTAVTESLNRTKWGTFTVQSVVFDTGLADSDFPVQ